MAYNIKEMLSEAVWLLKRSRKYWASILLYILLGILSTVLSLGGGVASKYLIDFVVDTSSSNTDICFAAAFMAVSILLGIAVKAVYSRVSAKTGIIVHNEIRSDMFSKILRLKWEDLRSLRGGDLINRINIDSSAAASSAINIIPNFTTALVQFIGALVLMLIYDPIMALIALVSVPFTGLASKYLVSKLRAYNAEIRRLDSGMMSFHDSAFANLQHIKAFGIAEGFEERLDELQEEYKGTYLNYNMLTVLVGTVLSLVGLIVYAGCFGWGAYLLRSGAVTYGTLMLFLQMSGNLSSAFSTIISLVPTAIQALTSAGRLKEIEELPDEEPTLKLSAKSAYVMLRDISFKYKDGDDNVLEKSSMTVDAGSLTALAGPSGEGKTTLLRILLGLVTPQEGSAKIVADGVEYDISPKTRSLFSYVPQGNTVFPYSIRDNLLMVKPDADEAELDTALETACAKEFVDMLPNGIDTVIGEGGAGLSEGQAQRIAIARALLCDAPIVLFDEATSALDFELEKRVLHNISRRGGKTCIISAHRPAALEMCSKAYRITEKQTIIQQSEE